ncbi:patatin-like phospholipase family protein [Nitratifractor sp.]
MRGKSSPTPSPRLSLVLGSGGARGYAHIGVIEELEARGYEIVCISGASMGALIGGLHACGKLRDYKEWVLGLDALDVAALLDFSWDQRGVVRGEKVMKKLRELIGKTRIEELPIDYTAVATDLNRNREVWFREGDLLDAIRASISIPTFFTPVERDGMLLVDGGVLNPLPVAPTMSSRSDLTLAVSLFGEAEAPALKPPKKVQQRESRLQEIADEIFDRARQWFDNDEDKEIHLFDIIERTIDSMQKTLLGYRLGGYPPDGIIEIPESVCSALDFHRAWEVIETGRLLAREFLDRREQKEFKGP